MSKKRINQNNHRHNNNQLNHSIHHQRQSKRESHIQLNCNILATPIQPTLNPYNHLDNVNNDQDNNTNDDNYNNNHHNTDHENIMILPPSQTITESLTALAYTTSRELEVTWDEIGLTQEERADQLTDLLSTFHAVCQQKIDSERQVAENYRQMIIDYKEEIASMHVDDEQSFNDELLTEHENYISVLEQRLDQMRPIIETIQKRESIIVERMQYEEFLKDPTRLQQRGAVLTQQLMKEERMSRRIKKDLPKYTDHLTRKLRDWSDNHDEPFLYKGEDYVDVMKRQGIQWLEYRDKQAEMKRQKKQQERIGFSSSSLPSGGVFECTAHG